MCSWQVKRLMLDAFNLPDVGGPESAVSETTSMIMISHDLNDLRRAVHCPAELKRKNEGGGGGRTVEGGRPPGSLHRAP
jgi:hypothetical protein